MRTSFLEIYNMAIAELKDPQLKATLAQNPIMFCKVMYNFFVNAVSLFTNPLAVADRLSKRDEPIYHSDTFTGDGNTVTFKFTPLPSTVICKIVCLGCTQKDKESAISDFPDYFGIKIKIHEDPKSDINFFSIEASQ